MFPELLGKADNAIFLRMSEEHQKPQEEQQSVFGKVLNVVAYPISAAIGIAFWHTHVRNASYDRMDKTGLKKGGIFAALKQTQQEQQQALLDSGVKGEEFASKLKLINQEFSKGMTESFAEHGFASMWKRYKSLNRFSRAETMLTSFTAAGIALGVILTAASSKMLMTHTDNEKGAER